MLERMNTHKQKDKRMVLYVEMEPELKQRLTELAKRRYRKISAEAILAIERYLDEEEAKEQQPTKRKGKHQ